MPDLVGPSHHLFFEALQRRRIWLGHLADAFHARAASAWPGARNALDSEHESMLRALAGGARAALGRSLPLERVLDDTPVESFLVRLAGNLHLYERRLFSLMHEHAPPIRPEASWICELEETSRLWGREMAQEYLVSRARGATGMRSVRGLYEAFYHLLEGGDFRWKPLLLRRYTDVELQYELRECPHRRAAARDAVSDRVCAMEAMVYAGFAQALLPEAQYVREVNPSYCVDALSLR